MLTLWIIGSIVWVLTLFLCYAICAAASRADEQTKSRHAEDTLIVEESAREVEKRIYQYR